MAWRAGGLTIGLIAGIAVAAAGLVVPPLYLWALATLGAAVTGAAFVVEREWRPWSPWTVAAAVFACALPLGYLRTIEVEGPPGEGSLRDILERVEPGTSLRVRGILAAEPEIRGNGQLDVELRVRQIRIGDDERASWRSVGRGRLLARVYLSTSSGPELMEQFNRLAAPAAYGWKIELAAPFRPIEPPLNPGDFDYGYFLRQTGVDARLRAPVSRVTVLEERRGNPLMEVALKAKVSFLETYKNTIRSPASRLTAAATLGVRRAVENVDYRGQDVSETLRHAGVGHVLAVSGLHVSVIAVMLFALFRMTGARPQHFVPILIFLLILFAMLTGARPSSVRAVIMNSVVLVAIAYLRSDVRRATVIGLSLSAFYILIQNPTVLFAASFLLSYGAVISLIVIAPPVDRLICSLRGFTLLFALAWFVVLLRLAGWHMEWLLHRPNLYAWIGLLWLLMLVGTRLNHRFPAMWRINLERMPGVVRLFIAAQLAIQLGMMIPLSAWFFGRFPVAGILVNLLAIPGVGILVHLGMLTGLVGMIPVAGPWMAIPFGAATGLVGDLFIALAHGGASLFPHPSTPMPSTWWLAGYYAALSFFLFLESKRVMLFGWLYRCLPPGPAGRARRFLWVLPLGLVLLPVLIRPSGPPSLREVRILAEGRYPIVAFTGPRQSMLLNAGDQFAGGRLVFDSLRAAGTMRLDALLLPSPDPAAGVAGAAALLPAMPVDDSLTLVHPEPGQGLLEALGDEYLLEQAAEGQRWAMNLAQNYDRLRRRAGAHGTRLGPLTTESIPVWENAVLRVLPAQKPVPRRFAVSARTPILHGRIHGLDWIFVTDTTRSALTAAFADVASCDVLVVPNLSNLAGYGAWLRTAIERTRPRLVIVGGNAPLNPADLAAWIPDGVAPIILETAREGAVTARFRPNGGTLFETYRGGTQMGL